MLNPDTLSKIAEECLLKEYWKVWNVTCYGNIIGVEVFLLKYKRNYYIPFIYKDRKVVLNF
jgi:hypothetical protein